MEILKKQTNKKKKKKKKKKTTTKKQTNKHTKKQTPLRLDVNLRRSPLGINGLNNVQTIPKIESLTWQRSFQNEKKKKKKKKK